MADTVYIRLQDEDDCISWCHWSDNIPLTAIRIGSLEQAAREINAHDRVVLVVPSQDVLLTEIRVPTRNRKKLEQAVPFALEDQVIDDIELQHFAIGDINNDQVASVAVVSKEKMNGWLELLHQAKIRPRMVISEINLLPLHEGHWSVLAEENRFIVRTGKQSGFVSDLSSAALLIKHSLEESPEHKPSEIRIFQSNVDPYDLGDLDKINVEIVDYEDGALSLFAKGQLNDGINLLQGEYGAKQQIGKLLKPWKAAAAILAVWLLVEFGGTFSGNLHLQKQNDLLLAQITSEYQKAFPGARVVEARSQMEQQLRKLKGDSAGQGSFLHLLSLAGPSLQSTANVSIRSIRSRENELNLELELSDLQTLDALKQKISASGSLKVEILSGATSNGKVEGKLKIWSDS